MRCGVELAVVSVQSLVHHKHPDSQKVFFDKLKYVLLKLRVTCSGFVFDGRFSRSNAYHLRS